MLAAPGPSNSVTKVNKMAQINKEEKENWHVPYPECHKCFFKIELLQYGNGC